MLGTYVTRLCKHKHIECLCSLQILADARVETQSSAVPGGVTMSEAVGGHLVQSLQMVDIRFMDVPAECFHNYMNAAWIFQDEYLSEDPCQPTGS